jgi:hypothetical protein
VRTVRHYTPVFLPLLAVLYYFDQFAFDSELLIQLKSKRKPTNWERIKVEKKLLPQ